MEKSGGEDIPDKGIVEHLRGVFKDEVKLMMYRTGGDIKIGRFWIIWIT